MLLLLGTGVRIASQLSDRLLAEDQLLHLIAGLA
jgi:hypothetical protein